MTECSLNFMTWISIVLAFVSAICWFRASLVKVTREQEIKSRKKKAKKSGEAPNLAGVTIDGWDMSGTFRAQTKWNAWGALFGALAIMLQGIIKIFEM